MAASALGPAHRKIIHVDMDAFFAAVEQRDRPELRGKPVIVGGSPQSRGVVSTCSYEARRFGIHSAMASAQAHRLCPDGIFLAPDFARYKAVSEQVRAIFRRYTDVLEPLSLDEAYLDVTENKMGNPSATRIAESIRADIQEETGLTASAGVANTKFIAKIASDVNKPDGLCVVTPEDVPAFLEDLPVRRIPGIGKVTEKRCHDAGIRVCGDFLRFSRTELEERFGSHGAWFHDLARGHDPRPVAAERVRKSCGIEDTFPKDLTRRDEALPILESLARQLEGRLQRAETRGRTVTLKVKYADFRQITRSTTLDESVGEAEVLYEIVCRLLDQTEVGRRPVRLLGIQVSTLDSETDEQQLALPFGDD